MVGQGPAGPSSGPAYRRDEIGRSDVLEGIQRPDNAAASQREKIEAHRYVEEGHKNRNVVVDLTKS